EGGSVREDDLPVGAGARKEPSVQLGPGEGPASQRHDPPAALGEVTEIERLAQGGLEVVDRAQRRIGKCGAHREAAAGSFAGASSGVTLTRSQSARGRAPRRSSSSVWLSAR